MDRYAKTLILAGLLAGAGAAQAQNPVPPAGAGSPDAASSPHQRATTGDTASEEAPTTNPEASAASSPHQHDAAVHKPSDAQLKMAMQDGSVPASFVKKAAMDGMTEVELGNVALSKSKDEKVRQFAQRMVADHGKANQELASIASSKGIDVPKALDPEHRSLVQSLSAKNGAAFDAAYSEHMNADHAKAIALFEGASKGTDKDLAAFAQKTLPTLSEHKEMAVRLASASSSKSSHE
jgi:putative membrane protein